jgi:hypothetical protein
MPRGNLYLFSSFSTQVTSCSVSTLGFAKAFAIFQASLLAWLLVTKTTIV